jgi:hypothetical protein
MSRRVALVRTYVSEELSVSFIRVTRIGELGTTLAVTGNRRKAHGVTYQKTPFFIVTAVKTSNLTYLYIILTELCLEIDDKDNEQKINGSHDPEC